MARRYGPLFADFALRSPPPIEYQRSVTEGS
jgi:hypothetical protein